MVVVVGQTAVDPVLLAGFRGQADAVDEHPQRRGARQTGRVFAPLARRLGHDLVDQRQQQLVLGGEVLVEGSQRGFGPLDDFEHREVGATGLPEDRQRRLHEAFFSRFGVDADAVRRTFRRLRHDRHLPRDSTLVMTLPFLQKLGYCSCDGRMVPVPAAGAAKHPRRSSSAYVVRSQGFEASRSSISRSARTADQSLSKFAETVIRYK